MRIRERNLRSVDIGFAVLLISSAITLNGCGGTISAAAPTLPVDQSSAPKADKILGQFKIGISNRPITADIQVAGNACSVFDYKIDGTASFVQAATGAAFALFANPIVAQDDITQPLPVPAGFRGAARLWADDYSPTITYALKSWSSIAIATVTLTVHVTINDEAGRVISASESAQGGSSIEGHDCGSGGEALAEATTNAIHEALNRLSDRLSYDSRLDPLRK